MSPLMHFDREEMILALQEETPSSREAGDDHRLHNVLFLAHGRSCRETVRRLGHTPRTVTMRIHLDFR